MFWNVASVIGLLYQVDELFAVLTDLGAAASFLAKSFKPIIDRSNLPSNLITIG
jgi:hypothetical protein